MPILNAASLVNHIGTSPLLLCAALILITFLLEDVAIVIGSALIMNGLLTPALAFAAVAFGIAAGDIALFGAGRLARRLAWLKRRIGDERLVRFSRSLDRNLVSALLLARIMPGLRLFTYLAAGFASGRFWLFVVIVIVSVAVWTATLMFAGLKLLDLLATRLALPLPLVVVALVIAAMLLPLCFRQRQPS
jgi:membrane protein DedA with SNARE-associated domain